MTELLIDPNIRVWVFLPIVVITFLVGIIRHYVSLLISSQKKVELTQIQDRWEPIHCWKFIDFDFHILIHNDDQSGDDKG